jgi:ankyrin repeat protein
MSKVSPLYKAVFDGDCDKIDALLAGRDVNIRTQGGDEWNLLHMALLGVTEPPNPDVIRHLIELGVDVNAKDRCRWTPLHFAARGKKNPAVFKLLIDAGADIDAEDDDGITPLHRSVVENPWNLEIVEMLLAAGAKQTPVFRKFINAVADPDKEAMLGLLAEYERTPGPRAGDAPMPST